MSLKSRARRISNLISTRSHQQILVDLDRLRLRPEDDDGYVEAYSARYTEERMCENCDERFPVASDKKGTPYGKFNRNLCPGCLQDYDGRVGTCIRCGENDVIGDEAYCEECEAYIDSQ